MKLIVLLSTYNGEMYLRQQLDSLREQTFPGVEILARDDGSSDVTHEILSEYAGSGSLTWYTGERLGASGSFWQLLQDAEDAEYYAFCDQDDVWDKDKLEAAVHLLEALGTDGPALVCGDVRVADEKLNILQDHMVRPCPADYPHALIRNLAPGCTYVFNRSARKLLCQYDAVKYGVHLHDWTAYQIIACLGKVFYDPVPHMSYRQHGNNVIGAYRPSMFSMMKKIRSFWQGPMKNSRQRHALCLEQIYGENMSDKYRELTSMLAHYREDPAQKKKLLAAVTEICGDINPNLLRVLIRLNRL